MDSQNGQLSSIRADATIQFGEPGGIARNDPSGSPLHLTDREERAVRIQAGVTWTGDLVVDLRHSRNWAASMLEVSVHLDYVIVRYERKQLAILDRLQFQGWLAQSEPSPLVQDEMAWSVGGAATFVTILTADQANNHHVQLRVVPESLHLLVEVV